MSTSEHMANCVTHRIRRVGSVRKLCPVHQTARCGLTIVDMHDAAKDVAAPNGTARCSLPFWHGTANILTTDTAEVLV